MSFDIVLLLLYIAYTTSINLEDYMTQIDNLIVRQLTTPRKKSADDILPNIHLYNLNLFNIIKSSRMQIQSSITLLNKLFERGIPQFIALREVFDYSVIQRTLEWEDFRMYHLNCTFDCSEKLWGKMLTFCTEYNQSSS